MVTAIDEAVGQIVDALEGNGLADNLLLVFTSDVSLLHANMRILRIIGFLSPGHCYALSDRFAHQTKNLEGLKGRSE